MRPPRQYVPDRASPRLLRTRTADRTELFTEAIGAPPSVYGERWVESRGHIYRSFEPGRSKLSAALVHGWAGPIPREGDRWLYLGAASGTTASHIADLAGPRGEVYAVERSPRPFARLLALAERWTNLVPILADARQPREYAGTVPTVSGVYADIAQPDQVEIVRANAELFLESPGTVVVIALKTASMGREREPAEHLVAAERELGAGFDLARSVRLDPFHKGHFLIGGHARAALFGHASVRPARASPGPRPARRPP
jgi:fibrillarin-like pre-rRNA processing protein